MTMQNFDASGPSTSIVHSRLILSCGTTITLASRPKTNRASVRYSEAGLRVDYTSSPHSKEIVARDGESVPCFFFAGGVFAVESGTSSTDTFRD
jgi:hypothetical protein